MVVTSQPTVEIYPYSGTFLYGFRTAPIEAVHVADHSRVIFTISLGIPINIRIQHGEIRRLVLH